MDYSAILGLLKGTDFTVELHNFQLPHKFGSIFNPRNKVKKLKLFIRFFSASRCSDGNSIKYLDS